MKGREVSNHDSKSELQVFLNGLDVACERISKEYIDFPVYSQNGTIYRERVYCYELYHQLRNALDQSFKYVISGEVDKRMHPVLSEEGEDKIIPDFLVHVPATMDNLVLMEVKSPNAKIEGICKDVKTIRTFINKMKSIRWITWELKEVNWELEHNRTFPLHRRRKR